MALVVLDASLLIAFFEPADSQHEAAVRALAARRSEELVVPASVYAEILVGPYRRGPATVGHLRRALFELAIRVEPIGAEIAGRAAQLRARHRGLRLPDALVLATGDVLDVGAILTAERTWAAYSRKVRAL